MVAERPKLRFFLDQNVPDSIGRYLRGRGHSALFLRHHIPDDSPDPVVGMTALQAGRILVSCDRDFNAQRFDKSVSRSSAEYLFAVLVQRCCRRSKSTSRCLSFRWSAYRSAGEWSPKSKSEWCDSARIKHLRRSRREAHSNVRVIVVATPKGW